MTRLRTAIVGCGKVAPLHAGALKTLPQSDFRAVCSRTRAKAQALADRFGVRAYDSVQSMISSERIDAVLVTTPHPVHAAPSITAMELGAHVLVEKPLASSLSDCDAMIHTARERSRVLAMVSQRRLYEPVQRLHRAIEQGKIGTPILGVATLLGWRDQAYYEGDPWRGSWEHEGGGVLVNQGSHQIDILQWLMGPVERVTGFWGNMNHPYIEVEDTAVAVLRFVRGGLGSIVMSNSQNPALYGKVAIYGSNGASAGVQTDGGVMFLPGSSPIAEPPINDFWNVPGEQELLAGWQQEDRDTFARLDAMQHYHRLQIQDFLQAILENRRPLVTGEEGRKTVEIFTAIYRSHNEGKVVSIPLVVADQSPRPVG